MGGIFPIRDACSGLVGALLAERDAGRLVQRHCFSEAPMRGLTDPPMASVVGVVSM